jgi:predicted NodU family carbamoyl transferase
MKALALTLGHNSSAIYIDDGYIVAGYEEERLNGIKASSVFPEMAINNLRYFYDIPDDVKVCVSHWFLDGKLPSSNKYWAPSVIKHFFPNNEIISVNEEFTHHDAHMMSAEVFAGDDFPYSHHIFVVDGFGTLGECYSVYEVNGPAIELKFRVHGFKHSIGLFYQYATAYCGMTMHQHEYKMLAYETHMNELAPCPYKMRDINEYIDAFSDAHIWVGKQVKETQLESLESIQSTVNIYLDFFLDFAKQAILGDPQEPRNKRILVSYFTQRHTENVLRTLFNDFKPQNLIVVGGVFYNVKVNSMLADMTPGKFCAMPLAGDQGAGLGVYQNTFSDLKWPNNLNWGTRPSFDFNHNMSPDIRRGDVMEVGAELIIRGMVNVVRGAMEFGPRTLCNTSTLALPSPVNAKYINDMNARTNEMPFALVVTEEQARKLFVDIDKIHRSLGYMIITRKFKQGKHGNYLGGAHYYPFTDEYTCRPQITDDPFMVKLLDEFGPLINTSFNYHGQPIVYDQAQITYAHEKENETHKISTIIV